MISHRRSLLNDMLRYARLVLERLGDGADLDDVRAEGVLWNMTLLGEAASQLPDEFRSRHAHIEFDAARYMRNRLVHSYRTIRFEIVADTAVKDLPRLSEAIERLLAEEPK